MSGYKFLNKKVLNLIYGTNMITKLANLIKDPALAKT